MSEFNDPGITTRQVELNENKTNGQYLHENDREYLERQRKYAPAVDVHSLRITKRVTDPSGTQNENDNSASEKLIAEKLRIISKARAL